MLLVDFAPAGLPNPAAEPLDLAIQQEQGSTSAGRWTNNTLRGDCLSPGDKKALGPWAFVGAALDVVRDYKSAAIRLDMGGEAKQADASLIVASNIQLYGGLVRLGARACIDDGKLDVCVFKGAGLLNYAQQLSKVASLQHLQDPQIEYHQCQELVVESSAPLPAHVDDEPFAETPVTIRVVPGVLKVILPQNLPQGPFAGG